MGFKFPYGNEQQLNLNWFIKKFKELLADWQHEQESIDGALDAEIQRAEDALSDVYTARDVTVAAKNDALQAKADALTAAANAAQYWQNAAASANSAATSAVTALQAAQDAADDADQTSRDRAGVAADKAGVAADKAAVAADKAAVAADKSAVAQDKDDVDTLKDAANAAALRSEGWAVGEQNGTPVASGSPYYENNSKYFKEQAEDVLNSIPADYTALSNDVDELKDDVAELQQQSVGIVKTIENVAVASFDDALASPMQKCEVTLEPIQEGSGDPSPDNVRPITGWTGCEVTRTGANLCGGQTFAEAFSGCVGYSIDTTNKTFTFSRTSSGDRIPFNINFKENTRYSIIFKYSSAGRNTSLVCYYTDGTSESLVFNDSGSEVTTYVFTSLANKTISRFQVNWIVANTVTCYYDECGIFEGVLTANDFEPYQGTTLSVTFPDTVYGGKYEFVSGNLKPYKEYDSYNGETLTGRWMSSIDKYVAGTTPTIGAQVVDLDSYDTTVQLTPQPISTLKGVNNLWANTGNINILKYLANSKNYIDERDAVIKAIIAKELATMTADTALTANDFRIVNDTLYRITANIAAGATLTPNTNCVATTVADVLKTLL